MNTCNNCGKELRDGVTFCTGCGAKINQSVNISKPIISKQKSNRMPIILLVCAVIILGVVLGKDSIMYKYYITKGDNESSTSQSINYYTKALKIKYKQDLIAKISEKVKTDEDFEATLENLDWIVKEEDLNKMYMNTYVSKAKENFKDKNYETTVKYLEKAQLYDYNIEKFEYYNDLVKLQENEDYSEEVNTYNVDSDYIISDSNTRYLTVSELSSYSKGQLALIRNEIFARHGYVFKNKGYNDYFNSMTWYSPNPSFSGDDEELNVIERENIKLIKSLER